MKITLHVLLQSAARLDGGQIFLHRVIVFDTVIQTDCVPRGALVHHGEMMMLVLICTYSHNTTSSSLVSLMTNVTNAFCYKEFKNMGDLAFLFLCVFLSVGC